MNKSWPIPIIEKRTQMSHDYKPQAPSVVVVVLIVSRSCFYVCLGTSFNTHQGVDENSSGNVSAGDTLIILSGLSSADAIDSSDFV